MLWGYALVWMPQYARPDSNPLIAKLKFLKEYGLQVTGISIEQVVKMTDAERDLIGQFLADQDMSLHIYAGADYFGADVDAIKRKIDEVVQHIGQYHALLRSHLVTTGGSAYHRFTREPSLAQQMERLALFLPALTAGCHDLGLRFGIENHGDYYCSDLVALCQEVPHLGIFLDTGNTYLIGEAPLPAYEGAAPYVVGTHFKDHHVRPCPDARPLHFEVGPSIIGDGDVPLRECYQILLEKTPNPDNLVMEIELIPPSGVDPIESFERSVAFIKSLPEVGK